jgi:hypothetical protein
MALATEKITSIHIHSWHAQARCKLDRQPYAGLLLRRCAHASGISRHVSPALERRFVLVTYTVNSALHGRTTGSEMLPKILEPVSVSTDNARSRTHERSCVSVTRHADGRF